MVRSFTECVCSVLHVQVQLSRCGNSSEWIQCERVSAVIFLWSLESHNPTGPVESGYELRVMRAGHKRSFVHIVVGVQAICTLADLCLLNPLCCHCGYTLGVMLACFSLITTWMAGWRHIHIVRGIFTAIFMAMILFCCHFNFFF